MALRGTIKKGKVVLAKPTKLPDGTEVLIHSVRKPKNAISKKTPKPKLRTLAEILAPVIGKAKNLPPDMSINHDHYLYGVPKRP